MLNNRFKAVDIAKYINGFNIAVDNREINIHPKNVQSALDEISFRLMPTNVLPYIPPTISPCRTSKNIDFLEHPIEAIEEYKSLGAKRLIAELKHMGSRSTIIVFKDKEKAIEFTNQQEEVIIYSRTGKKFFNEKENETISLRIKAILNSIDYFNRFDTGFVIIDAEILPWNAKGEGLLFNQYLPVLDSALALNTKLYENLKDTPIIKEEMLKEVENNLTNINKYKQQLENYCWDTNIENIKIAPFHLLAHEGKTFFDKEHEWHLNHFNMFAENEDNLFIKTPYVLIDLTKEESISNSIKFWDELTSKGYEGFILKTEYFLEHNDQGELILPMMKVRGKDYLRIIYGINYDNPTVIAKLKNRSLSRKRSLHYRELLLGVEALKRFSNGEDFQTWHEYILTILCMTNEVVDHRL
ncbi:MAG: polynucleotide kinasephosphatase [Clostridiaceae bacterium]|jgi:hypothetical protein|nr:polynucleotide kinasephosphatase [Clostridiaceae bacterium]